MWILSDDGKTLIDCSAFVISEQQKSVKLIGYAHGASFTLATFKDVETTKWEMGNIKQCVESVYGIDIYEIKEG